MRNQILNRVKNKLTWFDELILRDIFYFPKDWKYRSYTKSQIISILFDDDKEMDEETKKKKLHTLRNRLDVSLKKLVSLGLIKEIKTYPTFYEPIKDENLRNEILNLTPKYVMVRFRVMKNA